MPAGFPWSHQPRKKVFCTLLLRNPKFVMTNLWDAEPNYIWKGFDLGEIQAHAVPRALYSWGTCSTKALWHPCMDPSPADIWNALHILIDSLCASVSWVLQWNRQPYNSVWLTVAGYRWSFSTESCDHLSRLAILLTLLSLMLRHREWCFLIQWIKTRAYNRHMLIHIRTWGSKWWSR